MLKSLIVRGFFFKFLLSFVIVTFFNFFTLSPVYAVSSLNSCAKSVACAKTILYETGAKRALISKSGSVAAKTFTTSSINLTKGTSALTKVKSLGSKSILFGAGAYLAEKTIGHLFGNGLDHAQDKVMNYFCLNFDSNNCDRPGVKISIDSPTLGTVDLWSPRTLDWEAGNIYKPNQYFGVRTNSNMYPYFFLAAHPNGQTYVTTATSSYSSLTVPILTPFTLDGIPWDDWDEGTKNTAVERYFNDKTLEAFKELIEETRPEFPDMEPGDRIIIDTDFSYVGDTVVEKDDEFVYLPQPDNIDSPVISPPGNNSPDNGNPDSGSPGTNVTKDLDKKDKDKDISPVNPSPPKEDEPEEEDEEEDPVFKEECPECELTSFTNQNFLIYAWTKFIDEPKFPFDIFGDMPSGDNNKCPSISMFGYKEEFCIINESLGVLKYPIWIRFMLRMVFSI